MFLTEQQQQIMNNLKEYEVLIDRISEAKKVIELTELKLKTDAREDVVQALRYGIPANKLAQFFKFGYRHRIFKFFSIDEAKADATTLLNTPIKPKITTDMDGRNLDVPMRNKENGEISVGYKGELFTVKAIGTDLEPWAKRDDAIPQAVYDIIKKHYPNFVVLDGSNK